MALAHSQVLVLTVSMKDDDGAQSRISFSAKLPSLNQWTQDAIDRTKEELWTLIDPLTDAALVGIRASLDSYEDTYPDPAQGSDVEDKGVFLWTVTGNHKMDFAVPSILESKLVTSGAQAGIQIDTDDADVAAFVTAMTDGIDLNPFGILDVATFGTSRGEDIQALRDAYKQNRASYKSRNRRG